MMTLLKTCLHSLAVILEIKLPVEISDSIKLIEEVLIYLSTLINFAPKRCVICIKQMLKYMFYMNYMCRLKQYEYFTTIVDDVTTTTTHMTTTKDDCTVSDINSMNDVNNTILIVFDAVKKFSIYEPATSTSIAGSPVQSPISSPHLMSNESSNQAILAAHIKVFQPIVLRCLKVSEIFIIKDFIKWIKWI